MKEREVRQRVQAGANAWRGVERVMADRQISNRLKGKVMSMCVTPACLYGTETLALTELQQQTLQVCENSWVRKIARVTRADRRRMVELRKRDGSAEELDRETGEKQITVGWTRRKDGGWQTTEDSGRVMWAGQEETREAKAEMGGLC